MKTWQKISVATGGVLSVGALLSFAMTSGDKKQTKGAAIAPEFNEILDARDPFEQMRGKASSAPKTVTPTASPAPSTIDTAAIQSEKTLGSQGKIPSNSELNSTFSSESAISLKNGFKKSDDCSALDEAAGRCNTVEKVEPVDQPSGFKGQKASKENFLTLVADRDKMPPPPVNSENSSNSKIVNTERGSQSESGNFEKISFSTGPQDQSNDPLDLMAKVATLAKTEGRKAAIAGRQIKAGCRVLSILDDSFSIVAGETSFTTLSVLGPLSGCGGFPEGIKLIGEATANKNETRINIKITGCSDQQNSNTTMPCKGVVKDLVQGDGLRTDVYSKMGWSIVTGAATAFLGALTLSQLSSSSTVQGVMVDMTQANQIRQAFASAITSTGEQLRKGFDAAGTTLEVQSRSIVQVLFPEDSGPW